MKIKKAIKNEKGISKTEYFYRISVDSHSDLNL